MRTDSKGFIVADGLSADEKRFSLPELSAKLTNVQLMSIEEVQKLPNGSTLIFDTEVYTNFFFAAFYSPVNNKFVAFEQSEFATFNLSQLAMLFWRFELVGFNSATFDLPVLEVAIRQSLPKYDETGCALIKRASDWLIHESGGRKSNLEFEHTFGVKVGKYNHIDLIEVLPLKGSLKAYSARIHCDVIQDLPFSDTAVLTQEQQQLVKLYCYNDVKNTFLLFEKLTPELKLRREMSVRYGIDLRSKSDAQIAEAVINCEIKKITGWWPKRAKVSDDTVLQFNCPEFIRFTHPELQRAKEVMCNARFALDPMGSPLMPESLAKLSVSVGKQTYKLGMGGLHSTESSISHAASDEIILADNDVASFYPRTILNQGLAPSHLGEPFLRVYNQIVVDRLHAKNEASRLTKAGDKDGAKAFKTVADSLKIVVNGGFGKFGNKFSTLYSPQLLLQVTMTGQLALLMLIEALELHGIEVVSGNTDGIVSKYHKSQAELVRWIIAQWEAWTGYETEETLYSRLLSRDVNNYVAVKLGEKPKAKGTYSETGSAPPGWASKNPESLVCIDALLAFLQDRTPPARTIRECKDFRRFVTVRNVKGGGYKGNTYLGKTVRWYYAKGEDGTINYATSGNKVPNSDGAKPCMVLPAEFPSDVDFAWYENKVAEMLIDVGYVKKRSLFG